MMLLGGSLISGCVSKRKVMATTAPSEKSSLSVLHSDPSESVSIQSVSTEYFARHTPTPLDAPVPSTATTTPNFDAPFLRAARETWAGGAGSRTVSRGPIAHYIEYGVNGTTRRMSEFDGRRLMKLAEDLLAIGAKADALPVYEFRFDACDENRNVTVSFQAFGAGPAATVVVLFDSNVPAGQFALATFCKTLSSALEDLDAIQNSKPLALP